jgi:transposase
MSDLLFDPRDLPPRPAEKPLLPGVPRLRPIVRDQVAFREASLDELMPADHPVRGVWETVCAFDMSPWLNKIKAVEGEVGRNSTNPRLLLALWCYATTQAEPSARELAKLCRQHVAYQWLCGGVTLNYHTLADFRSQFGDAWEQLLATTVAVMMHAGLVTMQHVAQDGMRVRANAGKSSFRRRPTLEECLVEAEAQVKGLQALADSDPAELSRRKRAAQERAARERLDRVQEALRQAQQLQQERAERSEKSGKEPKESRASTTDPDARNMKFANGGYEPGVNVQFSTDIESGIIVGVAVTQCGNDSEQLPPMLDQLQEQYGKSPEAAAVDGGFASLDAIEEAATNHHCRVYAPLKDEQKQLAQGKDPYAPKKGDSPALSEWRRRMGTAAAKAFYKFRAQTAEWVNARCRNHGLRQMPVRGQPKCKIIAILHAITHNLMTALRLRAQTAMNTT